MFPKAVPSWQTSGAVVETGCEMRRYTVAVAPAIAGAVRQGRAPQGVRRGGPGTLGEGLKRRRTAPEALGLARESDASGWFGGGVCGVGVGPPLWHGNHAGLQQFQTVEEVGDPLRAAVVVVQAAVLRGALHVGVYLAGLGAVTDGQVAARRYG